MAVSADYLTFVLDQLRRVLPDVRAKRMFGGAGVYSGELIFGLVDDDMLYFKVDDETRPAYEGRGLRPFQPFGEGTATMQYYPLPEELLEDPDALRPWSEAAVAVARRAKRGKAKGTSERKEKGKGKGKGGRSSRG
jgi:DNA transformation protein and related proteins